MTRPEPTNIEQELLRATLASIRQVLKAAAASILIYSVDDDALVFEAADGAGDRNVIGTRISSTSGIAGMVLQTGMAAIVGDTDSASEFNRDFAEGTGYVPRTICAAPLIHDSDVMGVFEVLDPGLDQFDELELMTMLEVMADQVSVSMQVLRELRAASNAAATDHPRRTHLLRVLSQLPVDAFDEGRDVVLEAALTQLSRGGAR